MIPKIVFISFFVSLLCIIATWIKLNWERIQRWRLKIFVPHRLIRVTIHYDTTRTKSFYRMIPADKIFVIDDVRYHYDKESTVKPEDIFAQYDKKDKKQIILTVNGKKYKYDLNNLEKRTQLFGEDNCLEIHYWYNISTPINFDVKKKDVILSARQMQDMKKNDLFAKLLRLEDQDMLIMIILFIVIVAVIIAGINLYYSYSIEKQLHNYIKMVTAPAKSSILIFMLTCRNKKKM